MVSISWNDISSALNILGPIALVITLIFNVWLNTIRPASIKKKEQYISKLNEQHAQYVSIKEQVKANFNVIKVNNFFADLNIGRITEKIDDKIERDIVNYLEQYVLCSDIYEGCRSVLKSSARDYANQWIPRSLENFPIDNLICDDILINQYLDGNKLSDMWLRDNDNKIYHTLMKYRDEKEGDVKFDEFYQFFNNVISNDKLINRFRKEKFKLIEISNQLLSKLENEIKNCACAWASR